MSVGNLEEIIDDKCVERSVRPARARDPIRDAPSQISDAGVQTPGLPPAHPVCSFFARRARGRRRTPRRRSPPRVVRRADRPPSPLIILAFLPDSHAIVS